MNDFSCPDCFKEQRSLGDLYKQNKIDAQNFADTKKVKVAILQEGPRFTYIGFTDTIPAGTCEIIIPV
ncbi:MAG: hypothetical protein IPJ81_18020 [Chitinophagaceae bacterium]|nr:hypothetical protein [Chitinophagaceae bacterium]